MIKFLLIVIAVLAVAALLLFLTLKAQKKSLGTAKSDLAAYKAALDGARREAENLQAALSKQAKIEEAANAEKQALSNTADGDLVHRANNLF